LILIEDSVLVAAAWTGNVGVCQGRVLTEIRRHTRLFFCDVQEIIPVHQAIVHSLVNVWADAARVDHGSTLLFCLGIQEVVAL